MNAHTDLDAGIAERAVVPEPGLSLTGAAFQELTLYGLRPYTDELDYRPLPDPDCAETAIRQNTDGIVELVNVFHRKVALRRARYSALHAKFIHPGTPSPVL